MTTIYPLYSLYGNYLDGYYVKNYNDFISELMEGATEKLSVNLGITDGVTIINTLKGDFSGYNCAIVEREDGSRDLYKITDKQFIRRDIWLITMVLDCFSKYYTEVLESTILVNRLTGVDTTAFNPILFNDEGFTLSKVKTQQEPIYFDGITNRTNVAENARLNGYLIFFKKDEANGTELASSTTGTQDYDYSTTSIDSFVLRSGQRITNKISWEFSLITNISGFEKIGTILWYKWRSGDKLGIGFSGGNDGLTTYDINWAMGFTKQDMKQHALFTESSGYYTDDKPTIDYNSMLDTITRYVEEVMDTGADYNTYKNYNNKVVYETSTGKYYRISFSSLQTETNKDYNFNNRDTLDAAFQTAVYAYNYEGDGGINLNIEHQFYIVSLTQIGQAITTTITLNTFRNTLDQGFCVLWIPNVENMEIRDKNGNTLVQDNITDYITTLIEKYGGENGRILDVQETYFVPEELQNSITVYSNYIEMDLSTKTYISQEEIDNGNIIWYCYAMETCDGSLYKEQRKTVEDYKLDQMNEYILKSPSGASSVEFDIVKNDGVEGYNLKYNLRPYTSMYQLQPIYSGYYGANYCDTRGLVVKEDYSITQNTDLYETYKRQNINYINSFNSNQAYERSSLNLRQDYEKEQMKLTTTNNVMNGYVNALSEGLQSLNEMSAGFDVSAGNAGIRAGKELANTVINTAVQYTQFKNQQRQERQQLALRQNEARKQWKYSLGNIEALPLNTDKVSEIYNTNFKAFYLETYEPTEYEKYIYQQYLDLYGITVGGIIILGDREYSYIEGNIIKFSTSITNEEYTELNDEFIVGRRLYGSQEEEQDTST